MAVLPYTSGTTGRPKGCVHSHRSVNANTVGASAKLASSKDVITDYEKVFFRAAAKVQRETGVTIILPEIVQQMLAHWHPANIFENVLPVLRKAGITEEQIDILLIENPGRLFGTR